MDIEEFLSSIPMNKITPLHLAAENGHEIDVCILLKNNVDANVQDFYDTTPLHLAAKNGHEKIVYVLLENNADVDIKNTQNCTPIMIADIYKQYKVSIIIMSYDK